MPKSMAIQRVESTEVQGEGSWVELSLATYGEVMKATQERVEREERKEHAEKDVFARNLVYMQRHVMAWNWVNPEGHALPCPKDQSDIFLGLTLNETNFLLDALFPQRSEDDEKN